jgi:S-adenosylmethionine:tRNA ribosyltransferase-isomerase
MEPLKTSDFNYDLPEDRIAQHPVEPRDSSRLMVLDRRAGTIEHRVFRDIGGYLSAGDILVANNSRVIPARLFGEKAGTGGKVELLLLAQLDEQHWRVLAGGRRLLIGTRILLHEKDGHDAGLGATISAELEGGVREVTFDEPIGPHLGRLGHTPLPPYIHEPLADSERYQTVYARPPGSAAAPTAGLHFTGDLLLALRSEGVLFETCTLHVGLDTFKPVTADEVGQHTIHREWATLSPEAARRINDAKLAGGRLVAIGTTSTRVLETAALRSAGVDGSLADISLRDARGETSNICPWKPVAAFTGPTDLFIYPGYRYRAVDALITNFHLPQSSLLMMVSAFAGRDRILAAYRKAIEEAYRFYSFGDAMLIL